MITDRARIQIGTKLSACLESQMWNYILFFFILVCGKLQGSVYSSVLSLFSLQSVRFISNSRTIFKRLPNIQPYIRDRNSYVGNTYRTEK